mmetsp:Transcript_31922/g.52673  ORF Transcript_31922/g.52673 Transcript_31922/m.52673 type:complete len:539 (+) Transcript_31922:152-1768(+)|eukprot:CAMPEP_0119009410 /NCGR_PEP_ID=MMETSP1176-20130426/4346_1 /TAXON_ID=265551 /ORGANISM="Synedropsis recta cf, Strain CCMP1620" /LENGTH=538 /DNA_ID=CAMNT_0006961919 /DNA_START=152 /DNA_END=1768 /DNA_ORIENTATION=-
MSDAAEEEVQALKEMETILNATRPKHFGQGLMTGAGSILGGGIGAVGIVVLTPVQGAKEGMRKSGLLGGAVGAVSGVVVGAVQAVNVAAGGVVQGASQIVRGVANTPEAIVAPYKGKWWNENEGKWMFTNLDDESRWLDVQSEDNEDILGEIRSAWAIPTEDEEKPDVKDPYYYEILDVPLSVDASTVKRQYYILARRYSPDRSGQSEEAKRKFREIGTAYVVLTNPEFRERYDKHGKNFMDFEENDASDQTPMVDPMILYGMLFGSDKFDGYVGTLAAATSASVGDSPDISKTDARLLQKRRVTQLALLLAERLKDFTESKVAISKANWKTEAEYLTKASYGTELTNTIGKVYTLSAIQFLGSVDSGLGMPSMTDWAKKQYSSLKEGTESSAFQMSHMAGSSDETVVKSAINCSEYVDKSPEEQKELQRKLQQEVRYNFVRSMWTTTVLDITNTVHEAAQMVLFDHAVDKATRLKRGEGLKLMGEIFAAQPRPEGPNFAMDGQLAYEEVAFSAMLETCVRKDQWSRKAEKLLEAEES